METLCSNLALRFTRSLCRKVSLTKDYLQLGRIEAQEHQLRIMVEWDALRKKFLQVSKNLKQVWPQMRSKSYVQVYLMTVKIIQFLSRNSKMKSRVTQESWKPKDPSKRWSCKSGSLNSMTVFQDLVHLLREFSTSTMNYKTELLLLRISVIYVFKLDCASKDATYKRCSWLLTSKGVIMSEWKILNQLLL